MMSWDPMKAAERFMCRSSGSNKVIKNVNILLNWCQTVWAAELHVNSLSFPHLLWGFVGFEPLLILFQCSACEVFIGPRLWASIIYLQRPIGLLINNDDSLISWLADIPQPPEFQHTPIPHDLAAVRAARMWRTAHWVRSWVATLLRPKNKHTVYAYILLCFYISASLQTVDPKPGSYFCSDAETIPGIYLWQKHPDLRSLFWFNFVVFCDKIGTFFWIHTEANQY